MTVLTKPSLNIKKTPISGDNNCDEDLVINMQQAEASVPEVEPAWKDGCTAGMVCTAILAGFLVVVLCAVTTMQIYQQISNPSSQHLRYKGYCSIPISKDIQMLEYSSKMPPRWTEVDTTAAIAPNFQVLSVTENGEKSKELREMLDINVDDSLERISVYNNGHVVTFLHDFQTNITGIVDEERCFLMDLATDLVVGPAALALALQSGAAFDVALVRSELRAAVPPIAAWPQAPQAASAVRGMQRACSDRPTYRLFKDEPERIRKRSVAEKKHEYLQFAGKNVQQIVISNLQELQQAEQEQHT